MNTRLSPTAAGLALSGTLVLVFVLCALVQVIVPDLPASHMWVSLFTAAPLGSGEAWLEGLASNLVFGFVAGWLFAAIYNKKASWLERRGA